MAAGMPCDFPFAVVVALHMPPGAPSVLAKILDRSGPLPACSAVDGMRLKPGQIHVAVPDHHLLIEDHRAVLSAGPTENGYRPAINALFRSAALAYGPRAIGLLLSGVLDDGVLGAAAIRSAVASPSSNIPTTRCTRRCRSTPSKRAWSITKSPRQERVSCSCSLSIAHPRMSRWDATPTWSWKIASRARSGSRRPSTPRTSVRRRGTCARTATVPCNRSRRAIPQLPVPDRACLDGRGTASGARRGRRQRAVDRAAQPAGEGQTGAQDGRQLRPRGPWRKVRRPRRRNRTRREGAGGTPHGGRQ